MNTKLYVKNLAPTTSESELSDLFSLYGNVVSVHIQPTTDPRERGQGFVSMVTPEGALSARRNLDGMLMENGILSVSEVDTVGPRGDLTSIGFQPRRRISHLF